MARSTSGEVVNEVPWESVRSEFGAEDGNDARQLPMLLLALLVREGEESFRCRLGQTLSSGLQVDDEIEFPRPETPSH